MNPLLEAALQYAGRGWYVVPLRPLVNGVCTCQKGAKCASPGKHPWIKTGPKHLVGSSIEPRVLEGWWRRKPTSGIGIITGARSGICVVDVDSAQGASLLASLGGVPATECATTGRGAHLYFACPEESPTNVGEGLDIRGDGGLVVAPPSLHYRGKPYAWVEPRRALGLMPAELLAWFEKRETGKKKSVAVKIQPLGPPPKHIAARERRGFATRDLVLERKNELPSFLKALKLIPANCSYNDFFEIGAGIHDFDPSETGLLIYKTWAWQSEKHKTENDQAACESKWAGYTKVKPGKALITKASIYARALEIEKREARPKVEVANSQADVSKEVNGVAVALPAALAKGSPIHFPDLDAKGRPRATCTNTRVALQRLGLCCEYDTFHKRFHVAGQHVGEWAGDISDDLVHMIRIVVGEAFHFDPGSQNAFDGAVQESLQHAYHPVLDYLDGLQWDGQPRLERWLTTYMQAEDSPLTREMGRLMLLAAVRRMRVPGSKFDQILVLEGPEGRGKSLAIETLAGRDNFNDHPILTLDDRGQQEEVQGVWLYEISELSGIRKADIDRVKAFASRTVDRTRPAYARKRIDQPRTCVFFGTTNENTYLQSMTGNRRFWPVRTGKIALEALARDRDQLWAETAYHEKAGASVGLAEGYWGEAAGIQEDRREWDPWEARLEGLTPNKTFPNMEGTGRELRLASVEILTMWLNLTIGSVTQAHYKRLVNVMRKLGWEGPTLLRLEDGKPYKGFRKGL